MSQAEADRQPTLHSEGANGKPAVVFDGADDVLGATANGAGLLSGDAASIFIVMKQAKASANNAVLGWESNSHLNHLDLLFTYNDQLLYDYGNVSAGGRISAPQPERWDDLWNLVEVYRAGASGRVAVAGETVFSGTFAGELEVEVDGALTLGGVGMLHFGGSVAEVLVYNRALSKSEQDEVKGYLGARYGLFVSENQAPTVTLLVSRVLSNQDQITIQAVGEPRKPFEMVELELSYDLIHWETQDLQLPINLPLSFPLSQDMQFIRVKRINE